MQNVALTLTRALFCFVFSSVYFSEGLTRFYNDSFAEGDIIGCSFDQSSASVAFFKNGSPFQFVGSRGSLMISSEKFSLFPTVCIYNAKDGAFVEVAFLAFFLFLFSE